MHPKIDIPLWITVHPPHTSHFLLCTVCRAQDKVRAPIQAGLAKPDEPICYPAYIVPMKTNNVLLVQSG